MNIYYYMDGIEDKHMEYITQLKNPKSKLKMLDYNIQLHIQLKKYSFSNQIKYHQIFNVQLKILVFIKRHSFILQEELQLLLLL
jgi:hypothetical protein